MDNLSQRDTKELVGKVYSRMWLLRKKGTLDQDSNADKKDENNKE